MRIATAVALEKEDTLVVSQLSVRRLHKIRLCNKVYAFVRSHSAPTKTELFPGHTDLLPGHTTWHLGGRIERLLGGLGRFQNALGTLQEAPERESLIFHWFSEVSGGVMPRPGGWRRTICRPPKPSLLRQRSRYIYRYRYKYRYKYRYRYRCKYRYRYRYRGSGQDHPLTPSRGARWRIFIGAVTDVKCSSPT